MNCVYTGEHFGIMHALCECNDFNIIYLDIFKKVSEKYIVFRNNQVFLDKQYEINII
jgi:hypothetical protein